MSAVDLRGRLLMALLRRTPRHALTRLAGHAAGWTRPRGAAAFAVARFAQRYQIDLAEAELPLDSYLSVRALFTRALKPGLRPIAPGDRVVVSPADGVISVAGHSEAGELLQVKGINYQLEALLGDAALASALRGGPYATVYLSPHDYHRVHSPIGGTLKAVTYIPGDLWPVNAASVGTIPGLFTVNERMVFDIESPLGRCAAVMVGATVVGRLRATVAGVEPFVVRPQAVERHDLGAGIPLVKGDQIGIFDMGSTVVICFPPGAPALREMPEGTAVRVGERLTAGEK